MLPFNEYPPIKTYNHHAFGTGIITSVPEGKNWIYNNYIQLAYYPRYGKFSFDFFMDYIYCQPVFDREHIHDGTMCELKYDVINTVINALNNEKYVEVCVNEFYIPEREAYKTYPFRHNILLYGYDEKKKEFYTAGYKEDGHFGIQNLSAKILKKASPSGITFLGFRKEYDFSLKPRWIRYQLDAYYGKGEQPPVGAYEKEGLYLGIEAVVALFDDLKIRLQKAELIDIRPISVLVEHGRLMLERVRLLSEFRCAIDGELDYWKRECEKREVLLKRIYMYNISPNEKSALKVKKLLEESEAFY